MNYMNYLEYFVQFINNFIEHYVIDNIVIQTLMAFVTIALCSAYATTVFTYMYKFLDYTYNWIYMGVFYFFSQLRGDVNALRRRAMKRLMKDCSIFPLNEIESMYNSGLYKPLSKSEVYNGYYTRIHQLNKEEERLYTEAQEENE